jgi:DNA-binding beta-propeller fold protein YncE
MAARVNAIAAVVTLLLFSGARVVTTPTADATAAAGFACPGRDVATPSGLASSSALTPATPRPSKSPVLQPLVDVPLPGGPRRFDYQSLDPSTGRLYIAHMGADQVVIVDTATEQVVGAIDHISTVTGVLVVPELGRVFAAAAGDHRVAVIDARSLQVVAYAGDIGFPDGLDYAPGTNQVFVSDESGGGELVIDAGTNDVVATIDVGGEAGNTHYDSVSGCIIVAVQSRNQLVTIDPATDQLLARYNLDGDCQAPHGFLIDEPRRLAFVACEDNARLLTIDLNTMHVTATCPVGGGPDVLAFDPAWRRLYVASESGVVSIFEEVGTTLTPIGEYVAPHAHSIAVDPATHRVYLPLEDVDGMPVLRILTAAPPPDKA